MRNVELLAPAGNMAALHAAVAGGADAVYLGLETFNARRGADNFTLETLREACDFAHLRGVSVYVTMNTIILPDEVGEALECVRQAYRAGADGFIVQDIGLAAEISRTLPEASLHLSTQMNTHNLAGVRAAARLGASPVRCRWTRSPFCARRRPKRGWKWRCSPTAHCACATRASASCPP